MVGHHATHAAGEIEVKIFERWQSAVGSGCGSRRSNLPQALFGIGGASAPRSRGLLEMILAEVFFEGLADFLCYLRDTFR
jgi:hypothetical protein